MWGRIPMADSDIDVTFFVWGDTHFGYQQGFGPDDLRWRIIRQMNQLEGWPYPEFLGGNVARPDFVVHCGDIVDGGGSGDLEFRYFQYYMQRLKVRRYEVLGNHDRASEIRDYFLDRYGARSYAFACRGVHCVSLNMTYEKCATGYVEPEDLDFLDRDFHQVGARTPVVLFLHSRLDRVGNGTDVLRLLRSRRTILVMSAHIHKPAVFDLEGIPCVDVGHCRNHPIDAEYGRNFYVVQIRRDALQAVPWRWDLPGWERGDRWADGPATAERFCLRTRF